MQKLLLILGFLILQGCAQAPKVVLDGFEEKQRHEQLYYEWSQSRLEAYHKQLEQLWLIDDINKAFQLGIEKNARDGKLDVTTLNKLLDGKEKKIVIRKLELAQHKAEDMKARRLHEISIKLAEAHKKFLKSGMSEAERQELRQEVTELMGEAAEIYRDKKEQERLEKERKRLEEEKSEGEE